MADPGVLLTSPSPHPGWHHGRRWAADGGRPQARRVSWAVWAQRCPAWGPSDQLQAPRVAVGGRRAAAPSEVRQRRDPRALIARGGGRRPAAGSGRHGRRRAADSSGIRAPCTALGGSRGAAGSGAPRGPAAPGSGRSAQLTLQHTASIQQDRARDSARTSKADDERTDQFHQKSSIPQC
ncbi:hypothetical protein BS78_K080500 [Paspalum vaginatum]|uniref:Uncharacterized protein n=1 Tax=Paspalum vaginatum TaxID=158149 RepID=A0A9W7X934_9POAL|nr:hypothetical protein BS78_K080500 [Paspalum vaginatum]